MPHTWNRTPLRERCRTLVSRDRSSVHDWRHEGDVILSAFYVEGEIMPGQGVDASAVKRGAAFPLASLRMAALNNEKQASISGCCAVRPRP
jgi:hypothetical protein